MRFMMHFKRRLKWSKVPANGEVVSDLEEVEPEEDAGAAEFK